MTLLRRLAYATLAIAVAHIIFGAIVRITGSGMGCGDHWPTCYGHWFPPFDQPTLVIEWTHRLLAACVSVAVVALAGAAALRRGEPGVSGAGGVLRASVLAVVVVLVTAVFGAITVFLGNAWYATLVHLLLAVALLAALVAAALRAGGLGAASAAVERAAPRTVRSTWAAAGLALVTVLMGGATANFPGANTACRGFPLCSGGVDSPVGAHIQLVHRALAFLLLLHMIGVAAAARARREVPVVRRTAWIGLGLIALQIVVAATMVELALPTELRSLHQAIGILIWITLFTMAYLARIAGRTTHGIAAPADTAAMATRVTEATS